MASSIESLLEAISDTEDPIEELQCLKTALSSTPVSSLSDIVSGRRFDVIFSLLYSNEREQVELCVDILQIILMAYSPLQVAQDYRVELQAGLTHPNDTVKTLALTQVTRMAEDPDAGVEILNSHNIIEAVIRCLAEENITVAKQGIQCLSRLCRCENGFYKIFQSDLVNVMKEVMTVSDIIRYRVYELAVDVAMVDIDHLCISYKILKDLIAELTGDDILIRATAIEMVTGLTGSWFGQTWLAEHGVIAKFSNMIKGANEDPLSSLYLPGLVKFFGKLAILQSPQKVCEDYPVFLNKVLEMALDPDPAMVGVALDTLGLLGSTVEGKQVLQKTGEKFKSVLLRMSQLLSSGATELRVRCLEALSQLLTLQPEMQSEDLLALTESWFCLLSKHPVDMIRDISTQPFPELHCGALQVFTAIASQPWGLRMMVSTPGFMEFILDRSTSRGKEAKDAKFELVGSLLSLSTAADILGTQYIISLKGYRSEGPYYVSAVAAVDMEGA
ncbi:26S proteasome non-ATPase regulatory subunit 5 [Corythoichthys intestinalis]|uniref:26S proteasome non-ATPase regulatory subunit 5 n=1 Tax=Corythoichthys intestinalis TaxID=161448 RepID=UPI0025A52B83|nr:26S proteasome non-ATPase regulatory subunit 5 [Corythoichthys intestinalis]XP_061800857.1 26S proteasome non-ATPase regulatory subunit 5-like [Nerophis lumbriciformis]